MAAPITDVQGKLDASGLVSTLLSALTGPTSTIEGATPPAPDSRLGEVSQGAARVDASGVSASVSQLAAQVAPLLAQLPGAGDVVRPLESALTAVEAITAQDLPTRLRELTTRLGDVLKAPGEGGILSALLRLSDLLGGAPELRALADLLRTVAGASGLNLSGASAVAGMLPAAVGSARAVAALMALESSLAEAERLTTLMARQLDSGTVGKAVGALESSLGTDGALLSSFISGIDLDNAGEVDAAKAALRNAVSRMTELEELLARSLGFGEATLVHMDVAQVETEVAAATALLRSVDTTPISSAIRALVDALRPVLSLQVPPGPAMQLDALLTLVEGQAARIASEITALDLTAVTQPITDGLGAVTGVVDQLASIITGIVNSARAALEGVRQAVAALPFGNIADAIRNALQPLSAVMDTIRALIEDVEDTLGTVAGTVDNALTQAETAVDTFKAQVLALLKEAEDFIKSLHLDQVVGQVADNVRGFANTLAQAQMRPYFDTAVDVIDTAADAFELVPFGLLPDDIKSEVDKAAEPIRAIDIPGVKDTVEGWFEIGPDGKFQLRKPIEDALHDLQVKYESLITEVRKADPRQLEEPIDTQLARISTKVDELLPRLTLQPVEDAINSVKGSLGSFDVHAALQPLDDAFAQVLSAVDAYSPAALITPLENRLKDARDKVLGELKLDTWDDSLDLLATQLKGLMDRVDPSLIRPQLEAALSELRTLLTRVPDLKLSGGLGALFTTLLSGTGLRIHPWTFDVVLGWLGGDSGAGALAGRTSRIADAVLATQASVRGLDLAGLSTRVGQKSAALRASVDTLRGRASGAGQLAAVNEIQALVDRLDAERRLASLTQNRTRYLALLDTAAGRTASLRATGLSEVDEGIRRLGEAFAPFQAVRDFFKSLLRTLGIPSLDTGLREALLAVFQTLDAERLSNLLTPVVGAVRGRIAALVDLIVAPVKDAIADLQSIAAALDLAPLREGLQSIYDTAKAGIQALAPSTLLAPSLASFDALKAELLTFDPLSELRHILDSLKATKDRVVAKLKAAELLASPIAIYDEIIKALEALNLDNLIAPVLDALDDLAGQVDEGLDRTTEALQRLQQALPAPGSGGSASGSVSVG
ncbi:hypothetical protein JY651_14550 [Pyxidicoccus parkwayensis]|uniref:Uncharacterized protein n=1 Tax=Pyxidicoccus parkwayensis TaxID=2813578 RepID=A0ABX7P6F2_9BACT|nr:hypothetical protein [Pyxidicoccus parkwaysis]QSQ26065.1 hypothetical protein JY651_14550 [Pyxidicoccus parkwaysis]